MFLCVLLLELEEVAVERGVWSSHAQMDRNSIIDIYGKSFRKHKGWILATTISENDIFILMLTHPYIKYCCRLVVPKVFQLNPRYKCCFPPGHKFTKVCCELGHLNNLSPLLHFFAGRFHLIRFFLFLSCLLCVFHVVSLFKTEVSHFMWLW